MTPTSKLRWIERQLENFEVDRVFAQGSFSYKPRKLRVLQQWWEDKNIRLSVMQYDEYGTPVIRHPGEWRDVPLEKEND